MFNFTWIFLSILAIINLSRIITEIDLLNKPRELFKQYLPTFKKIAICRFCQCFWLSCFLTPIILGLFPEYIFITQCIILPLAIHELCDVYMIAKDRWENAPFSLFVTVNEKKRKR